MHRERERETIHSEQKFTSFHIDTLQFRSAIDLRNFPLSSHDKHLIKQHTTDEIILIVFESFLELSNTKYTEYMYIVYSIHSIRYSQLFIDLIITIKCIVVNAS